MEPIEEINNDFNVKKPKKKGAIIAGIIAAIIVVVAIAVYLLIFARPQYVFNKAIDKIFSVETNNYDSIKFDSKIKASVKTKDQSIQQQLSEIDKCAVKMGMQADFKKKQEIVDLGLEYDNKQVVDAQVYYDSKDIYMYLDGLFDKYIKVEMEPEQKEQIEAMFDSVISEENSEKNEKVAKILKKELKSALKEYGEFDKEKATIDIGDKEKKVSKSTLTLTQKELYKLISDICTNLSENEEFLDNFEESPKEALEQIADEIKNTETSKENKVTIAIYTKTFKYMGLELTIYSEDQETTISVIKEDKDLYTYSVSAKDASQKIELLKGEIKIEKDKDSKKEQTGKITITAEIKETGTIKLVIDYNIEYDKGIDKIDTLNSISTTEITEKDMQSILQKLQERPLIGNLIKASMNTSITTNNLDSEYSSNKITTSQNEVKDENYGYSVTYSIPETFKYEGDYSNNYRKYYSLEKENSEISANVSLGWYTDEEYKKEKVDWDYDYYKNESNYYKNAVLGELKTIKIGNTDFKYQILSYESNSEYYNAKYQKAHVWCMLDNEHVYSVEFEATNMDITEDIIKGFLNINVNKI